MDSIRNKLSRNDLKKAHLQRDLSRVEHLASQDTPRNPQRRRESRGIKRRLANLKTDRISLNTALAREAARLTDAKAALEKCERERCPGYEHSYYQPPTNGDANGDYATTNAGFSLGVLGNYALNYREASYTSDFNNNPSGEQSHTIDGFGFGLLMQYALASHPALFFYGMYSYPGDHTGTALSVQIDPAASLETRLRVFKHYSLVMGLAYTLLHYGQSNLSLGLGFDIVGQSLTAQIEENGTTTNVNRDITTVSPHLLMQCLFPIINQHMALMFGLSAALLPNMRADASVFREDPNQNSGQYFFRMHAGIELMFLFGLTYSFG